MAAPQPLVYGEKWSLQRQPGGFFHNLGAVGFSSSGRYVAFGGAESLLLADINHGEIRAILRKSWTAVVALQWFMHDSLVFAFEDGTICNVSLHEVRTLHSVAAWYSHTALA